ncbi:MAG: trypsin-like peptidase domain-containing protein [Granulosicoccaceae bacterium]
MFEKKSSIKNLLSVVFVSISLSINGCGGGSSGSDSGPGAQLITDDPDPASFVIGTTFDVQGREVTILLGSAFAIDDRLLATNAHVTNGVLDFARRFSSNQVQLTRVSAFQSSTGEEFPLLEALVHPSYTGDTRSPDVGLFVSRTSLPARLALATGQEASQLIRGDAVQVSGFPGDVSSQIFQVGYEPGISVPLASLFSGTIQAIRNFDERVVLDPPTLATIDMWEYSMDTSGGTSGSPALANGKVVGVHNSGVVDIVVRPGANGQLVIDREILATASFGIHVKHLLNLIDEYNTGVLEADKRFRLPPSQALISAGGGQSVDPTSNQNFSGNVSNPDNGNVAHQLSVTIDQNLQISGTSNWPENSSLGFSARSFSLLGSAQGTGELEFGDNTPEVSPGFRKGVYTGNLNPASGVMSGKYFELNETTNELFYFGDWTARAQ